MSPTEYADSGIGALIDLADAIFRAPVDWEAKYDAIFALEIWNKIRDAGYGFDWYDPDTTYEEDITEYHKALLAFRDRVTASGRAVGWLCPSCGRSNSPENRVCWDCSGDRD